MNYSRPNLFQSSTSFTDLSVNPNYAVSGNRAKLLRLMYNLDELTITANWAFNFTFPPSPTVYYSYSNNHTISSKYPVIPSSTQYGYYYSATDLNPATVWPDPASRVLSLGGNRPMPDFEYLAGLGNDQYSNVSFRPSLSGSTFSVGAIVDISGVDTPVGERGPYTVRAVLSNTAGYQVLASSTLTIVDGTGSPMSFPIDLIIEGGIPIIASFTVPFTVTALATFHPII